MKRETLEVLAKVFKQLALAPHTCVPNSGGDPFLLVKHPQEVYNMGFGDGLHFVLLIDKEKVLLAENFNRSFY